MQPGITIPGRRSGQVALPKMQSRVCPLEWKIELACYDYAMSPMRSATPLPGSPVHIHAPLPLLPLRVRAQEIEESSRVEIWHGHYCGCGNCGMAAQQKRGAQNPSAG